MTAAHRLYKVRFTNNIGRFAVFAHGWRDALRLRARLGGRIIGGRK